MTKETPTAASPLPLSLSATLRSWAQELVLAIRRARALASEDDRAELDKYVVCTPPTRAVVLLAHDEDSPVIAFGVELNEDVDALDLQVDVLIEASSALATEDVRNSVDHAWRTMRANWFPGRPPDPPMHPAVIRSGRLPSGGCYVIIPGGPDSLAPRTVVDEWLRRVEITAPAPSALSVTRRAPNHLFAMGQGREHAAIERFMYVQCGEFLESLGFPFGWWCAIELPRAEVFGDGADGDVDLIAGPLQFDFDDDEWTRRLNAEAASHPLLMPRGAIVNYAAQKAAAEGHVLWPPSTNWIACAEIKATRYEGGELRPTYKGTRRNRVKGQLEYLLDRGVDFVTLFTICATEPVEDWLRAGAEARSAFATARPLFAPQELPACGEWISILGAVKDDSEGLAGAIIGPRILRNPTVDVNRRGDEPWRHQLRQRLAAIAGTPPFVRTFILRCDRCGLWRHAANATIAWNPCPCATAPAA